MKIASTMEIRLQNALNIIDDLGCNPGITTMEIARNRNLSIPTISNIINILKNNNIVMAAGTGESSGGRRPVRLSLNPQYLYSIGVSIARHTVYLLLIDFAGNIYEKKRYYIQFEDTDTYWYKIKSLISQFQEKFSVACSVGIALPGFVSAEENYASATYTLGKPLLDLKNMRRILGNQISVNDSCRLAAMAQVFKKTDVQDNFFVLLSRRVSGILIYDRKIFNMKGSSIDVGSMLINQTNEDISYGISNSFYELCSAGRIIDDLKRNCTVTGYDDFFEKIEKGNQELAQIWDSYLQNLSVAIYNIYSIFKVDVVIGGEMAKYIEPYTGKLNDYINALSCKDIRNVHFHCSIYGEYDDAYGAALEARSLFLIDKLPEILKTAAAAVPLQTTKL